MLLLPFQIKTQTVTLSKMTRHLFVFYILCYNSLYVFHAASLRNKRKNNLTPIFPIKLKDTTVHRLSFTKLRLA